MADRSFTDYVRSRFFNECYLALEGYVEENKDSLELELRNVFLASINPSGAELNFPSTPVPLMGFHG